MNLKFLKPFTALAISILLFTEASAIQVFIMAGQSNTEGVGFINEATPANQASYGPDFPDVTYSYRYVDGSGPIIADGPFGDLRTRFGYHAWEISLGRALDAGLPGEDIAIIKFASSGTNLSFDWNENLTNLYDDFVSYVNAQVATLTLTHTEVNIAGMFWHQGESDADDTRAPVYGTNLVNFFNAVRSDLGAPDMNFVAGKLSETGSWALANDWEDDVNAGIQSAADTYSYIATIDTADDISLGDDGLHFDSNGHIDLGLRMADSYLQNFAIPEPSALGLLMAGLCLGVFSRKR